MATLVNKMNRDVKVIIPNMREFRTFYSDNEGATLFFKRDWEEEKTTKQEEQVWSEEDEEMLNSCISSIEESKENRYAYRENDGDTSYDREIAWLKSLPLNHKKKNEDVAKFCSNEWSEEDEKMRNLAIEWAETMSGQFSFVDMNPMDFRKIATWLKSLRPQPKQEKSDYITPHKQFFKWIYDRLVNVHKENPDVDYMISFKKRIEELSFDEPNWKPSEEQMEAIKHAYNSFPNDCPTKSNLMFLYRDLKKLM